MEIIGNLLALAVIAFFIWGYHHDGILERLNEKKLKDMTINDFVSIVLFLLLIFGFFKFLSDLF